MMLVLVLSAFNGCSQKSAEYGAKGAAVGAIGAGMVGALTDLIVDGRVNPYRLQRNMVGGAIVGGAAGAAAGHNVDEKEKQAARNNEIKASDKNEKFRKKIGDTNYKALESLIFCHHEEAFRLTLKSVNSSQADHELAAYVIQALIDKDRNNSSGVKHALEAFIAKDEQIKSIDAASRELDKLYLQLQDERRIDGKNPTCQ